MHASLRILRLWAHLGAAGALALGTSHCDTSQGDATSVNDESRCISWRTATPPACPAEPCTTHLVGFADGRAYLAQHYVSMSVSGGGGSCSCPTHSRELRGTVFGFSADVTLTTTTTAQVLDISRDGAALGLRQFLGSSTSCSGPGCPDAGPATTEPAGTRGLHFWRSDTTGFNFDLGDRTVGAGAAIARAASGEQIVATLEGTTTVVDILGNDNTKRELFRIENVARSLVLPEAFAYITKTGDLRRRSFDDVDVSLSTNMSASSLVASTGSILAFTTEGELLSFDRASGARQFSIEAPPGRAKTQPALAATNATDIYLWWGDSLSKATLDGKNVETTPSCEPHTPTDLFVDDAGAVFLGFEDALLVSKGTQLESPAPQLPEGPTAVVAETGFVFRDAYLRSSMHEVILTSYAGACNGSNATVGQTFMTVDISFSSSSDVHEVVGSRRPFSTSVAKIAGPGCSSLEPGPVTGTVLVTKYDSTGIAGTIEGTFDDRWEKNTLKGHFDARPCPNDGIAPGDPVAPLMQEVCR